MGKALGFESEISGEKSLIKKGFFSRAPPNGLMEF